jgi:hypothetical protein
MSLALLPGALVQRAPAACAAAFASLSNLLYT